MKKKSKLKNEQQRPHLIDRPSREEYNSDQKDRSFNPLPGYDRSWQGAVCGDIDGNSINNYNGM